MLLTVGKLKDLLKEIPDDYIVGSYDGEDTGISIEPPNSFKTIEEYNEWVGKCTWISTREDRD